MRAYLPFLDQPGFLSLGAQPVPVAQWVGDTGQLARYHANKLALRAQHREVYRSCAGSEAAQHELQQLLAAHLCEAHSHHYRRVGEQLAIDPLQLQAPLSAQVDPLWHASLWIADDICLLQREQRGWVLCAASLCAPSHWRLGDKIGRPLEAIHAPVPGLQDKLGAVINRTLDKLAADQVLERGNWTLTDSEQLAQFESRQAPVGADQPLFLRVERQSLRKLPDTGAVAFTIRVELTALEALSCEAPVARQLLEALNQLEPEVIRYKSLSRLAPALAAFAKQHNVSLADQYQMPR